MKQRREVRFTLPPGETVHQSVCSACRAPIFWMLTKNDKRMPLDIKSARRDLDGSVSFESHFAVCPKADHFRRKR